MIVLESAQAGLSWLTILKRRESYRNAFDNFNANTVAGWNFDKEWPRIEQSGIIRNVKKTQSAIGNAQSFLNVQDEFDGFHNYLWQFVDHQPIINRPNTVNEIPAHTPLSDAIAKDMKRRGFTFWGTTICYAWLQALGVVNDHIASCDFQ